MMEKIEEILHYWFGQSDEMALPSAHRTEMWFAGTKEMDDEISEKFGTDLEKATSGAYDEWINDPRGCLAQIILLDQFSRHIYRNTPRAFDQDQRALDRCLWGIQNEYDHALSLIERVFFYFPFMHSENLEMQTTSVRAFQILVNLAFPETRSIFESFLNYAVQHYEIIKRFGRFPHRNAILGRASTSEEEEFLKTSGIKFQAE